MNAARDESAAAQVRQSQNHGFTLVELLVVIGIISLLASLLLPALSRSLESARGAACKSNMKQLLQAMSDYSYDNRDYFPPLCVRDKSNAWFGWEKKQVVGPYFDNNQLLRRCSGKSSGIAYNNSDFPFPVFNVNVLDYYSSPTWSTWKTPWHPITRGRNHSRLVALIDVDNSNAFGNLNLAVYRHAAASNVAFADGHVGNSFDLPGDYAAKRIDVKMK